MLRLAASLVLSLACLALLAPGTAWAQGSDTLWVEEFMNQTDREWVEQTGFWWVRFTEYRGQCTTLRSPFLYEASATTHAGPGVTPILDWRSIAKVRGHSAVTGGTTPGIIALRHNVTGDRQGFGLELNYNQTSADQIRIVRYTANYAHVSPSLAAVDTTLVNDGWYVMKFSVLHTVTGVELQGKVWRDGEPEPVGWNLEAVSPVIVSGADIGVGAVGTSQNAVAAVDYVIVLGDRTEIEPVTWGRVKKVFR